MLPMGTNDDKWIADVANYVRNDWGNEANMIHPEQVASVRKDSKSQAGPYTLSLLEFFNPPALDNQSDWKLTSNYRSDGLDAAVDGSEKTRWYTGTQQSGDEWVQVEFPEAVRGDVDQP